MVRRLCPGVIPGEPEAGAAADAHHGAKGNLPPARHQPESAGALGLSLPAHGPGLPLPGGHHGLAQPVRGGLAVVQHAGG